MVYLVTQLVSILLLAAALGFLTGFLLSRWLARRNRAEFTENWRAKVLTANRKVDILRWELKTEAATHDAALTALQSAMAELESQSRQQKAHADVPEVSELALDGLSDRIAKLEQTLGTSDAIPDDARAEVEARNRKPEGSPAEKDAGMERLWSQPAFVPSTNHSANGDRDDLKLIFGIGPALEKRLNRIGVYTFSQIANWTAQDIQCLDEQLPGFSGRVLRDNWVMGAQEQYAKKYGHWREASEREE